MDKKKSIVYHIPLISSLFQRTDNLVEYCTKMENRLSEIQDQKDNEVDVLTQLILQMRKRNIVNSKERLAIFTAIIGNYDELNEPLIVENDFCDYYCFTDNKKLHSDIWEIVLLDEEEYPEMKGLDSIRKSRYVKTHPHLFLDDYKHSFWMDANLQICKSVPSFIDLFLEDNEILTFIHPERSSIYQEADECIALKKDDESIISNQVDRYNKDNYPENNGLVMTNILYRRHTDKVKNFDQLWWEEIKNGSRRDQLSFNYISWKTNTLYDVCKLHAYRNRFFRYNNHLNK